MPAPTITRDDITEIKAICTGLFVESSERRTILLEAFIDEPQCRDLELTGKESTFLTLLVDQLNTYGNFKSGEPALWRLLQTVREKVGVDKQTRIQQLAIEKEWATPDPAANAARLRPIRDAYLQHVATRCAAVEMYGLPTGERGDTLPLDTVYISLSVETRSTRTLEFSDGRGTRDLDPTDSLEVGNDPEGTSAQRTRRALPERVTHTIGLPDALQQNRLLVVTGDPGAGKTTLTRFLARLHADALLGEQPEVHWTAPPPPFAGEPDSDAPAPESYGGARLPLLLRVSRYAEMLAGHPGKTVWDALCELAPGEGQTANEAAALFRAAIESGNALVILDGLDEITDARIRVRVAECIDQFATGMGRQCRVLVTSRIVGYESARLTSGFTVATLRPLEMPQITRFVRRRMAAYALAQRGVLGDAGARERAQTESAAILEAVERSEGVRRLAVNPLLLGVLCLVYSEEKRMPERRVELYKTASWILLER